MSTSSPFDVSAGDRSRPSSSASGQRRVPTRVPGAAIRASAGRTASSRIRPSHTCTKRSCTADRYRFGRPPCGVCPRWQWSALLALVASGCPIRVRVDDPSMLLRQSSRHSQHGSREKSPGIHIRSSTAVVDDLQLSCLSGEHVPSDDRSIDRGCRVADHDLHEIVRVDVWQCGFDCVVLPSVGPSQSGHVRMILLLPYVLAQSLRVIPRLRPSPGGPCIG